MKIVVVPIAVYDPFFRQVFQGVQHAREQLHDRDVDVEWLEIEEASVESQLRTIRKLREQKIEGMVICPVDENLLNEEIGNCVSDGIPVATFCLDAPASGRFFHIGQQLRQGGRLAGYLLGRFTSGRGRVGIITGFFSIKGHEERREGFIEVLERDFPEIQILWQKENHDHWEESYQIAKKSIESGDELTGIYVTAGGPFGVAQALEEAGLGKRVAVVCFDFVPDTVKHIRSGGIDAAIGQNPYVQGYRSVMEVYRYVDSGLSPESDIEHVDLEIMVRENVGLIGTKRA
jgi:ABC-type sugar transport system substrate-binding protein